MTPEPPDVATDQPSPSGTTVTSAEAFAALLPANGRLIGIDGGTKTLGLALSDQRRKIASPLDTIIRRKFSQDAEKLATYIEDQAICGLVIGLPLNLDGSSGPRAQATRALARNLNRLFPIPILLWDERLTTVEAERMLIEADQSRRRRGEVIDKLAATLILQSAIDRIARL